MSLTEADLVSEGSRVNQGYRDSHGKCPRTHHVEWVFPSSPHQPKKWENALYPASRHEAELAARRSCHGKGGMCAGGGHLCPIKMQSWVFYGSKGEHSFRNGIGVPAMIQINSFLWQALLTQPSLSPFGVEVKFLGPKEILICLELRDSKAVH